MSAPLRFLGLAIVAYVGFRAAASAVVPLGDIPIPPPATPLLDALAMSQAAVPPAPELPPAPSATLPSALGYGPGYGPDRLVPGYGPERLVPVAMPYPVPTFTPTPRVSTPVIIREARTDVAPYAPPELAMGGSFVAALPETTAALGQPQATPGWTGRSRRPAWRERLSLSSWAMLREPDPAALLSATGPSRALAPSGMLGGSQAGTRLTYKASERLAVGLRFTTPLDQQTQESVAGEAALGVSWQPLRSVPVRLTAERRQRVGPAGSGRNAFAFIAEGGLYGRPLGWGLLLDGYGQAGLVGLSSRDLFGEGGITVSRPLLGKFALGGGLWGGAQPGLHRLDAGPRLSYRVSPQIRAHLDYRWRMIGNASPSSGPAITLASDF